MPSKCFIMRTHSFELFISEHNIHRDGIRNKERERERNGLLRIEARKSTNGLTFEPN